MIWLKQPLLSLLCCLSAAAAACHQDIVSQTSWDEFLEIRSRVFLMQHEATPRESQDAAAQQRSARHSKEQQQQQRQQQEGVVLAAALQQKLEQLGLQASGSVQSEPAGGLVLHQSVEPPSSAEPATANGTQHAEHPGAAAAGVAAAVAHPSPPSRGRMSSSGGQKGSPKSYVSACCPLYPAHMCLRLLILLLLPGLLYSQPTGAL
jgi:pyruvate/2-oxoglutarate dehydrogenase complex dihydrolipoamide acyltransferase (E2) component